jgi:hypothetical protein
MGGTGQKRQAAASRPAPGKPIGQVIRPTLPGGTKGGGKGKGKGKGKKGTETDWEAIFNAERGFQMEMLAEQRRESELARQREEQQRREEESKRQQELHNLQQKSRDETAMQDYSKMKQAAAAQAVGGITPVAPSFSRSAAPGLAPVTPARTRRPSTTPSYSPVAAGASPAAAPGNLSTAPTGVGLGGGWDPLRQFYLG